MDSSKGTKGLNGIAIIENIVAVMLNAIISEWKFLNEEFWF